MKNVSLNLFDFWGKTSLQGFYPVVCHMLDVGIVAHELLASSPDSFRTPFCSAFHDDPHRIHDAVHALHRSPQAPAVVQVARRGLHCWRDLRTLQVYERARGYPGVLRQLAQNRRTYHSVRPKNQNTHGDILAFQQNRGTKPVREASNKVRVGETHYSFTPLAHPP